MPGFGPKFGLDTRYRLTKNFSLLGGIETSLYSVKAADYMSDTTSEPYYLKYKLNHRTLLPMVSSFIAGKYNIVNNFNIQVGVKSLYTFDFTTNGYISIIVDRALTNNIGWSGVYTKLIASL